ncbi:hypothetical protein FACS1894132_12260 [Clostridia bacterium]|nr:hypothetical protein FACS1894132_12260 [Clostridia bacterium]
MKFKKILASTLALLLVARPLFSSEIIQFFDNIKTLSISAEEVDPLQYLTYSLNADSTGYIIDSCDENFSGELVIPDTIEGLPVVEIGDETFSDCFYLTSIIIPESVINIGDNVFSYCVYLTSIEIPESVINIGNNAFLGCYYLTSIIIPESVINIGDNAFNSCTSLTSIEIPSSVTRIGVGVFLGCYSLTSITIPSSVTSIGYGAFESCGSLTSIIIPSSVTSIGDRAFTSCENLVVSCYYSYAEDYCIEKNIAYILLDETEEITDALQYLTYSLNADSTGYIITRCDKNFRGKMVIPDTINGLPVVGIGDSAFYECRLLAKVILSNSITSIGEQAFSSCTRLTNIIIPESVTSIGNIAFSHCHSITSIVIPDNVMSIGLWAFEDCSSLISITVDSNNNFYCDVDGILFDKNVTTIIQYPSGNKRTEYVIPDSVINIGDCAFSECYYLVSIIIPNSVMSIDRDAFRNCASLISLVIPNGVTNILDGVFIGCVSLTIFVIPDNITSIGHWAFLNCRSLISIVIPNSVTSINSNSFETCENIVVSCYSNSYAENYCIENNISYILLDELEPVAPPFTATLKSKVFDVDTPIGSIAKIESTWNLNDYSIKYSFISTDETKWGSYESTSEDGLKAGIYDVIVSIEREGYAKKNSANIGRIIVIAQNDPVKIKISSLTSPTKGKIVSKFDAKGNGERYDIFVNRINLTNSSWKDFDIEAVYNAYSDYLNNGKKWANQNASGDADKDGDVDWDDFSIVLDFITGNYDGKLYAYNAIQYSRAKGEYFSRFQMLSFKNVVTKYAATATYNATGLSSNTIYSYYAFKAEQGLLAGTYSQIATVLTK